jgi:hypothetical protein
MAEMNVEVALHELAVVVEFPPTPDIASAVRARLAERPVVPPRRGWLPPWPRAVAVVLLALLVLVLAGLAVADRLGLRGVTIVQVTEVPTAVPTAAPEPTRAGVPTPTPPPPGAALGLGNLASLAEARSRASFALLLPEALGEPDAVYVNGADQVSLVYAPRPGLPPAPQPAGVGLLLTEFRADIDASLFQKGVPPTARIESVRVGGNQGYFISGAPHSFFVREPNGNVRDDRSRLAGNTLLWEQNGITNRIESALGRDGAIRIAESLR